MKNFKKIKKKDLALSTLVALACVGHIGYAADSATTTTTENGVTNNYWDITINNIKEDSGLELGTNARARGNGSIATGTGSLAVGNNAVATGGNETKSTITSKLNENRQRLAEISTAQNAVTNLANEIQKIRAEQAKTIEAGERVKQVRLAKEKAHQDYLNKQNAWSTEVANSAEFLRNAQSKLDDLNNRLGAVNRLGGVDINSEDGLTAAATNLKRMTEEGSTLDLPLDSFYKEYIRAHYKAIGDLRLKEIEKDKYGKSSYDYRNGYTMFNDYLSIDNYQYADYILTNYYANGANNYPEYVPYIENILKNIMNKDIANKNLNPLLTNNMAYFGLGLTTINNDGTLSYLPESLDRLPTNKKMSWYENNVHPSNNLNFLPYIEVNKNSISEEIYNNILNTWDRIWNAVDSNVSKYNNPLLNEEEKNLIKNSIYNRLLNYKSDLKKIYYQRKYEETGNTVWLDKKQNTNKELESEFNKHPYNKEILNLDSNKRKELDNARKQWLKENINDVKESNKITTNKLTSDLETALQINKNAVAEKEKQIAALKAAADQAKTNWESINPNASDLLYMEQYEALMRQLTAKSQELQQNQERLTALKNALTLHDLTNVGENAMAIGTNSLSTGSNSIAIGTGTIVTGENSISIGKGSAVTGTNSIAVGVGHIVIGNNAGAFGDPNTIYGDNSYAFGNNNTIGNATTTHTVGTNTFVLGSNVTTKANNSVVLGKDSTATEDNVVSIGSTTATRKLVNVTDGSVAENSKEGINGNQLWKVSEAKDGAINKTAWQAALGTGTNAAGNTGLVTGDTLHTALSTVQIDPATLNAKANTSLDNITDDGKTVIRNLSKETVKLENGTNTTIESRTDGNSTIYKVNVSNDAITGVITPKITELSNAIDTKLATKANKDASNISTEDASKWSEKLGTGSVTDGNTGLVTGSTVHTAITNAVNTATSNINNGLDSKFNAKANTALDNISDDGKTVIRNLSKEAVKLENGSNTSVESRVDGNSTVYKVNVSNDAITGAIAPKLTELATSVDAKLATKANKDASNITSEDASKWSEKLGTGTAKAGDKGLITGDTLHTALANVQIDPATLTSKANTNASNLTDENVKEWTAKLGTGTVGQGDSSNGLVTGKSVYEAIQKHSPKGLVKTDGKTITVDKAGTATHIDFSGTDEHGNSILRDITGVVTNPNDPTSVVNMDTLQNQSQDLQRKLTKETNHGTATASALAALHPLDYDPDNKASFAVAQGRYNGASATAFGTFIRPNDNIMLSLAGTINSGDHAYNAGLSFKIGSGSNYKKISKNEVNDLRKKNDNLQDQLNQLKDQLSKLSTKLSNKRTSFPDVPKEHWANEAVETLHGNDVLDGYPDGEFKGDKQMTRYEYAQMLYKGLK